MTALETLAFILVVGVVTFRVALLVIFDTIFDAVRNPVHRWLMAGGAFRKKISELLTCHICMSVWIAAGAVVLTDAFTSVPLPVWVWLGASTISIWTWNRIDPYGEHDG